MKKVVMMIVAGPADDAWGRYAALSLMPCLAKKPDGG